jgi:galactokinase
MFSFTMEKMTDQPMRAALPRQFCELFSSRFASAPRIFRAPGRVNLIGEHTDYNDGFVLPAAIDLYIWTAIAPRTDHKLHVFSENLNESAEIDLTVAAPQPRHAWSDYVHGVALMLQKSGVTVPGSDLVIHGNVPTGAGLSSSAALEVSVLSALLASSGNTLPLKEVARLCQRAENEFVGARVGIMDQFASCFGSAGHALLLDCRSLEYQPLSVPEGITMVICNTMVKHGHSGGEYNDRRAQCEEGVRILKQYYPAIKALRDVTLAQLESQRTEYRHERMPELIYRRCHHIVSENERVLRTAEALKKGDLKTVSVCMAESHLSMKNDYEISCRELDIMVELSQKLPGLLGARMTGGGFGGCTINLVRTDSVEEFRDGIRAAYRDATQIDPEIYLSAAGAGVTEIKNDV